jgi:tRNA pseudouridine55 synthase
MDGVLVVDKCEGWTSHDVVGKMRRITGIKRIGHLGTLDPLATGVLPLVVGRATRLAQFHIRADKVYTARIRFGFSTGTYDRQGEPTSPVTPVTLIPEQVEAALAPFRGTFAQVPPPVSAKKVNGVPAYKLARKNITVELKPVEVTVFSLDLLECGADTILIRLHCAGGFYVRSLAHELGQALGCGAHIEQLQRNASGEFLLEQARTISAYEELAREGRLTEALIPAAQLLPDMPGECVDSLTMTQIRQGRDFRVSPFRVERGARYVKALSPDGELLAIGEVKLPNLYHPILVF